MNAQEFYHRHSANGILMRWLLEKDISDFLGMNITGGIILVDALTGDGLQDQISPDLLDAFYNLMGDKVTTAEQVRDILVEKLMNGDASVLGLINKIKGQVGENIFAETAREAGFSAHLADLKNQEAWDCCVTGKDGIAQYVQVKTYESADGVVEKMKEVAEKVTAGTITGEHGEVVKSIDFAVPQDIYADVVAKAHDAGLTTKVILFDLSADDAAHIVQDGFDNVAYLGLGNFFEQLAGATAVAGGVHFGVAMARAFLLQKSITKETAQTVALETGISAGGIATGQLAEGVFVKGLGLVAKGFPATALLVATGLTARGLLRRLIARHDYLGFLQMENALLRQKLDMPLLSAR